MLNLNVSIATISWARNEQEEKLLRDSLEQLAARNIPVYITDGGSSKNFLQFLRHLKNFTVFEEKGLWLQAGRSIKEASKAGSKFILYTEPDKLEFFEKHLPRLLQWRIKENTGVIVASRSSIAFASFPAFQQMTETTINHCCAEIIGREMDYCYGPFLFNAQLVPLLTTLDEDCGWGWRPFLFAIAHRLGYKIESYVGEFYCPPDQREDNATERIYRMKQLTQNINGLVKAAVTEL